MAFLFYILKMLTEKDVEPIRKLLAECHTDRQIGEIYGTSKQTIYSFRCRHSLRTNTRKGRPMDYTHLQETLPQETLSQRIENGLLITLCPARWAFGVFPQKNLRCHD